MKAGNVYYNENQIFEIEKIKKEKDYKVVDFLLTEKNKKYKLNSFELQNDKKIEDHFDCKKMNSSQKIDYLLKKKKYLNANGV